MHGSVLQSDGTPAHPAVVTVVKTDGTPVDWSRGDTEGKYSVVLPGPGKYLVLANALGWVPRAEVFEFVDDNVPPAHHAHRPTDPLRDGNVRRATGPEGVGHRQRGQRRGVRFGPRRRAGDYCMPLPPAGRYIVTMLEPRTLQAFARKLVLDVRSAVVDIDAPAPAVATGVAQVRDGSPGR